jgi:FlaA1/EpsC-like NDP-sugar epimerase
MANNFKSIINFNLSKGENIACIGIKDIDEVVKSKLLKIKHEEYRRAIVRLKKYLQNLKDNVIFWGAGGRCISIINEIASSDLENKIIVVDSDSSKWGHMVPGTNYTINQPFSHEYTELEIIIGSRPATLDIIEEAKQYGYKNIIHHWRDLC